MLKRTALFDLHRAAGARMVDFGGWEMPLHYGSQLEEHVAVRAQCGLFDVSHMRVIDASGPAAGRFLRLLLANDVDRAVTGQAIYSCMLQADGGVIDDLIVYRVGMPALAWRIVVNAGTADTDLQWMQQVAREHGLDAGLQAQPQLCLLALQGPRARALLGATVPALAPVVASLAPFHAAVAGDWFVARTGYTGEDGCEIALPAPAALDLWQRLVAGGARPCGLGARDTLRLEAGMNLYGNDMDASVTPLESGLAWTVDLRTDRAFIGRAALEAQRARGGLHQLLGLKLRERGVLRSHQEVQTAHGAGMVTSGTFGPTMGCSIALARLPAGVAAGDTATVQLRSGPAPALVCRPPFVRNGKILVQ